MICSINSILSFIILIAMFGKGFNFRKRNYEHFFVQRSITAVNIYLLCNSTMNLFAMMQLFTLKNKGAAIAYAGAVLFFISDCTLFLVRYYKNPDVVFRKHFTVMLTYLAGEFFITLGMMMVLR